MAQRLNPLWPAATSGDARFENRLPLFRGDRNGRCRRQRNYRATLAFSLHPANLLSEKKDFSPFVALEGASANEKPLKPAQSLESNALRPLDLDFSCVISLPRTRGPQLKSRSVTLIQTPDTPS